MKKILIIFRSRDDSQKYASCLYNSYEHDIILNKHMTIELLNADKRNVRKFFDTLTTNEALDNTMLPYDNIYVYYDEEIITDIIKEYSGYRDKFIHYGNYNNSNPKNLLNDIILSIKEDSGKIEVFKILNFNIVKMEMYIHDYEHLNYSKYLHFKSESMAQSKLLEKLIEEREQDLKMADYYKERAYKYTKKIKQLEKTLYKD